MVGRHHHKCIKHINVQQSLHYKLMSLIKIAKFTKNLFDTIKQHLQTRSFDIRSISHRSCSRWNACRNTTSKHVKRTSTNNNHASNLN